MDQDAGDLSVLDGDVGETIYTVGHSNLSGETFLALIAGAGVRVVADVRAVAGSRRHPQFAGATLRAACAARAIAYRWMPALGGRRPAARASSPHLAWEVAAFRHYADYAETEPFRVALAELEGMARADPTAFMCAEALWWRCHRRLIADQLLVRGWRVLHLAAGGAPAEHRLPDFARVADGRIVYDVGVTMELPRAPRRRRG